MKRDSDTVPSHGAPEAQSAQHEHVTALGTHTRTHRARMDRHGAHDAPHVFESHGVPPCLRFPPNPRATHARCGHPSWKKLDAQAHRRDCEAAAEAGRRRPAAGAPSPPRSMLTHPRFRPGSMHSAADSSVHLATLTLGRRGVRTRVAVVDAPARPRQVFFTEGCMSENGVLASHGHGSCLKRVVRQPCGSAVLPSWLFLSLAPRLVWTLQWPA